MTPLRAAGTTSRPRAQPSPSLPPRRHQAACGGTETDQRRAPPPWGAGTRPGTRIGLPRTRCWPGRTLGNLARRGPRSRPKSTNRPPQPKGRYLLSCQECPDGCERPGTKPASGKWWRLSRDSSWCRLLQSFQLWSNPRALLERRSLASTACPRRPALRGREQAAQRACTSVAVPCFPWSTPAQQPCLSPRLRSRSAPT